MTLSGAKDSAGNLMDRRHLDLHHRCEPPATAARARSGRLGRAGDTGHRRLLGGRGRGEVPDEPGRLHHRHPVLQGRRQHRHPHRLAVDHRRHQARLGHLHRRDRHRLAAGDLRRRRVPVAANTTYVASYYAPVGRYAINNGYFASAATTAAR